jgi:hypothetical protein
LYEFYYERLREEITYGGHIGVPEYMMLLEEMEEENMKPWEKRMMSEIKELRLIDEDIKALNIKLKSREREVVLPEWFMDPRLKQEAYQLLMFAEKYRTVEIEDTYLIPVPLYRGPDFDERLREAMDVDAMIEADNEALKEFANNRIALPARDLSKKDNDLISKMNLLAKAVEVEEPPVFGIDINEEYIVEEMLRANLPSEKRILVDEMYKILMFNNRDPETYTISFWSEYFNISPATIRNVVNYMAFPICDQKTKRVTRVLYFQDTELAQNTDLLENLDR